MAKYESQNDFERVVSTLRLINNEYYNVISKFPKIFLETLSIIGIIFACVFYVYLNKEILDLIPVLSLLAISVVRLMPSFNLITSLFSTISYYTPSLKVISKELNSVENNIEENYFPSKNFESIIISLKDISFYYEKEKKVLENISLKINEKDKILITMPIQSSGADSLYRLMPVDFIAVHSFRFTIIPILKTVDISIDIGSATLINHGIV